MTCEERGGPDTLNVILIMKMAGNIAVLQKALAEQQIRATGVSDEPALDRVLEQSGRPSAALVDVSGFGRAAWGMCATLQDRQVPFIVLSTPQERQIGEGSLKYGALSLLQKPVTKSALLQLLQGIGDSMSRNQSAH